MNNIRHKRKIRENYSINIVIVEIYIEKNVLLMHKMILIPGSGSLNENGTFAERKY